jgi:hypothetical protein
MFKVQLHAHFKAPVQTRINVAEIFILIMHKTFFFEEDIPLCYSTKRQNKRILVPVNATVLYFIFFYYLNHNHLIFYVTRCVMCNVIGRRDV